MELLVDRKWKKSNYTISNLFIDGVKFCNVLEDTDRNLKDSMTVSEISKIKIKDKTAIPSGTYNITLDVVSPKFGGMDFYKTHANGGRLPRLLNVKGFDGILIHVGDGLKGADLTSGCLLVGNNTSVGQLSDGKETFKKLYKILKESKTPIKITIM